MYTWISYGGAHGVALFEQRLHKVSHYETCTPCYAVFWHLVFSFKSLPDSDSLIDETGRGFILGVVIASFLFCFVLAVVGDFEGFLKINRCHVQCICTIFYPGFLFVFVALETCTFGFIYYDML